MFSEVGNRRQFLEKMLAPDFPSGNCVAWVDLTRTENGGTARHQPAFRRKPSTDSNTSIYPGDGISAIAFCEDRWTRLGSKPGYRVTESGRASRHSICVQ
jgi:hypothetical protein